MLSTVLGICGVLAFWPASDQQNEFLLFNDLSTAVLFLPSFWIVFFSLTAQLLLYFLRSTKYIYPLIILLYLVVFAALFIIAQYNSHLPVGVLILIITSVVGILHLGVSILLQPLFRRKLSTSSPSSR